MRDGWEPTPRAKLIRVEKKIIHGQEVEVKIYGPPDLVMERSEWRQGQLPRRLQRIIKKKR